MGLDYVLFHCTYTIPLTTALTVAYYPFFTRKDRYKISALIIIAVLATIPWDSYLIRTSIWTYPPDAVVGYTIFDIPIEEVFFFVIQTYTTSVGYCIFTKTLVLPMYLRSCSEKRRVRDVGKLAILGLMSVGGACVLAGGRATYLGLILIWVCPVLIFQWILSYPFLVTLPWKPIAAATWLPTAYLWIADARAMRAGTWMIEMGMKLDYQVYGLEVEEAIFFLATNTMIIAGLVGCDYAFAIQEYRFLSEPITSHKSSLKATVLGLIHPIHINEDLISDLCQAVERLKEKSQSMFLGSALFQGQLRIDLIFLYSFCRVIDDLIDEAENPSEEEYWIIQCNSILHAKFNGGQHKGKRTKAGRSWGVNQMNNPIREEKYKILRRSIELLPLNRLSKKPLCDLLEGFKMDLAFNSETGEFPIHKEYNLDQYSSYVASTVAALVIDIILWHYPSKNAQHTQRIRSAAKEMGRALQCINIARDIHRDAAIGRVYIPTSWLKDLKLTPQDVLHCSNSADMYFMQEILLNKADSHYLSSRGTIEELPSEAREPVRATVEAYMDIGRLLRKRRGISLEQEGKMKVPLGRRLVVGWWVMLGKKW
ncbi:terpenoid synthase [Aspergillus ellipticus CBS 707.79]|uniref:Bifunctional lycopene cyclase/phytoene synthase n=1 Tax=Aspergillus ellipticus CBS 707.79 TaxID=1448320 RepID=A0A319ETP7_9EURO|nr:terpenoid synthase [Aspergillus ellipticus CBS 707.79]